VNIVLVKKKKFGGVLIRMDENLSKIVGKKGKVPPSELTKGMWTYIKRKKLMEKGG